MDIIVNVGRKIVVDDMGDVGNVKPSSSNRGGNHNRSATSSESLESHFTLTLSTVAVDGSGWKVIAHQKVTEHIGHTFCFDEDECESEIFLGLRCENIQEDASLVIVFHIFNLLGDVLRGTSDSANAEEDVILEEIFCEHLDVTWEGSTEHEGLAFGCAWHIFALNDTTDLGLETHVQHTISLIENEVLDVGETNATTFDEIYEATGCRTQEVTATLDLAELLIDIGTSVDNGGSDPRTISKLASLLVDLRHEFTRGRQDKSSRVRFARAAVTLRLVGWCSRTLGKRSGQDRE